MNEISNTKGIFEVKKMADLLTLINILRKIRIEKAIVFSWKTIVKKRSLSQNALMHVWFADISRFLVNKGRTAWTPAYTKTALKHKYLGYTTKEVIDVETGEVITRDFLRSTRDLDKGEAFFFLTQIENWCLDYLNFSLTRPDDCEYMKIQMQQNGVAT